jgi:hypothetical protein
MFYNVVLRCKGYRNYSNERKNALGSFAAAVVKKINKIK